MAYTVNHFYKKVLEGTDKMGSDLFTIPYVMNRLESATYDFIGESIKYIENTQEITDDIATLYKPFNIPVITDPNRPSFKAVVLPTDYQHLMEAVVLDKEVQVRKTRIIKHGQEEIFEMNPNTRASAEYPTIVRYDNMLTILSTGEPTHVIGTYVKKPVFGKHTVHDNLDEEIAVNLPDHAVDKIIKTVVNEIFIAIGDPRAQAQLQNKLLYRKRGD